MSDAPLLSEAKQIYLRHKQENRPKTFVQSVERAIGHVVSRFGDRPIDSYSRLEANQLRDDLIDQGMKVASVRRIVSTVRAVLNLVSKETGLDSSNAFSGILLKQADDHGTKRNPISIEEIRKIQLECRRLDDEPRWLIALISDTGLRLSEAVGLVVDDIHLEPGNEYIALKPHPWRRLKTRGSARMIPLVGSSLWAAQRAISASDTRFLFPKYCSESECKSNSASAALNKWLSPRVSKGRVVHSFRHSFRDRLRAVECPSDIIDRLGGWSVGGVGEGYGTGYPIEVLRKWIEKII